MASLYVSNNNIYSAGAQSFDELQRYNNTLKKVILINNNIGDLGDHGDQELNVILIASLPCFPFSHDLSVCFNLLIKEVLMYLCVKKLWCYLNSKAFCPLPNQSQVVKSKFHLCAWLVKAHTHEKVCFLFNSECRSLSSKREGPSVALLKPQFLKTNQVFFPRVCWKLWCFSCLKEI